MTQLPSDQHITYQFQYRKCGKVSCSTCRDGHGHGPYWYAYWREGARLRSGYVGKISPCGEHSPVIPNNVRKPMTIGVDEVTSAAI